MTPKNVISQSNIHTAYAKGIIDIVPGKAGYDVKLGKLRTHYVGGKKAESMTVEEYKNTFPTHDVVIGIYSTLKALWKTDIDAYDRFKFMLLRDGSKWIKVVANRLEDGFWIVEAKVKGYPIEPFKTIAYIDDATKRVIYCDKDAEDDYVAKRVIKARLEKIG